MIAVHENVVVGEFCQTNKSYGNVSVWYDNGSADALNGGDNNNSRDSDASIS